MVRRRYLVTGRVQGVGFRAFVHHEAQALGLRGCVRNLEDGRVEAVISGSAEQVAAFEKKIASGPSRARVQDIEKIDVAGALDLLDRAAGFSVAADGEEPWSLNS